MINFCYLKIFGDIFYINFIDIPILNVKIFMLIIFKTKKGGTYEKANPNKIEEVRVHF